jgi:predicted PurR-regulated permease PerM
VIPSNFQRASLIFFLTLFLIALGLNIALVRPYLLTLLMGTVLAILTHPIYRRLRAQKLGPKLSATLIVLIVFLVVTGPLAGFIVVATKQAIALGEQLAYQEYPTLDELRARVESVLPIRDVLGDTATLQKQIRAAMQNAGKMLSGFLLNLVGAIPRLALNLFLALMTCFFLLIDGKDFLRWVGARLPMDEEIKETLSASYRDTTISVIWSTLAAALAQAGLMLFGFAVLGVPGAFLAAGATFILAWIPMVGSGPVWIAGGIYLYTQGEIVRLILMVLIGLVVGVIDNFVRAWVLKGRGDMHPLVSLVAIFGGLELFGILGVFFGPILVALLITLVQVWPVLGRRFGILSTPTSK